MLRTTVTALFLALLNLPLPCRAEEFSKSIPSLYDLSAPIPQQSTPAPMAQYRGTVALIVNTASRCGYTSQYDGLQKLYLEYKDRGFVVLGFPSNDFGQQEPGTNEEILSFCSQRFGVTFPLFAKSQVKGPNKNPIFAFLTDSATSSLPGEVRWNFEKFLVNRQGRVIARFPSATTPEDTQLREALERALAESF